MTITASRSTLYADGLGRPLSESVLPSGRLLKNYADGFSLKDAGSNAVFASTNMAIVGASLSQEDFNFASSRATTLTWDYDSPGLWNDFKSGSGSIFGVTVDPIRTSAQETELLALRDITRTYIDASQNPEKYNPALEIYTNNVRSGLLGSAVILATRNSDPATKLYASRVTNAVSGMVYARGSAGVAKANLQAPCLSGDSRFDAVGTAEAD